jgi:hypothetical protein
VPQQERISDRLIALLGLIAADLPAAALKKSGPDALPGVLAPA